MSTMRGVVVTAAAAFLVVTASAFDFSSPLAHRVILSSSAKSFQAASVDGRTSLGDSCNSTLDCPSGTACVAGSAQESVQSCVQQPVCGGNLPGNCPGLVSYGQLVCAWSPVNASACSGSVDSCIPFNDIPGIYKCMSVDRCDSIGGSASSSCSSGCKAANGLTCNGRGSCQTLDGAKYTCACNSGWTGVHCEVVVDGSCQAGVGSCGVYGKCTDGKCLCEPGYSGAQCESSLANTTTKAPLMPLSPSATSDQGKGPTPDQTSSTNWTTIIAVIVIIVAVIAIAVVAYLILAKKKREREAAELRALINRDDEIDGERVTTPKSSIQVL